MRTRIVRRFLWSAFVLFATSLFGVDLYVTRVASSSAIEDLRAALAAQARMLASELPAASPHFDGWVKTVAAQSGSRVTVLDRDGAILADSEPNAETALLLSVALPLENSASPVATLTLYQ